MKSINFNAWKKVRPKLPGNESFAGMSGTSLVLLGLLLPRKLFSTQSQTCCPSQTHSYFLHWIAVTGKFEISCFIVSNFLLIVRPSAFLKRTAIFYTELLEVLNLKYECLLFSSGQFLRVGNFGMMLCRKNIATSVRKANNYDPITWGLAPQVKRALWIHARYLNEVLSLFSVRTPKI